MQYPLISEYIGAIQDAADNLDSLSYLSPVFDNHNEPYRSSGAFAIVFKMCDKKTGKCYALKCFTEEQTRRQEAYKLIADELETTASNYVTSVKYLEKEIFVDCSCENQEFPVLLMDWVEGDTMEMYVSQHYKIKDDMDMLCFRFCQLAAWLRSQLFAHGDIKPDNIIVRADGTLTLVDYDGMYVPAMRGWSSPTIGTKDFCHPLRDEKDFDETIDDFSLASMALSLKAISLNSDLYDEYGAPDRMLFSADDYRDLSNCKVLKSILHLMYDTEINTLLSLFLLAHAKKNLAPVSFRLFNLIKPKAKQKEPVETFSTEATDEDLEYAIYDEWGVAYSKDGRKLLKTNNDTPGIYTIRKGAICICDGAFKNCFGLKQINIPESVTTIGKGAFNGCSGLKQIIIPRSVTIIHGNPFANTKIHLYCKSPYFIVDNDVLYNKEKSILISYLASNTEFVIPESVTAIGDSAFYGCSGLKQINIPENVTAIGHHAFCMCRGLKQINIPESVTAIGDSAFSFCFGLTQINIPENVTAIGDSAFDECSGLKQINIPESVTTIGKGAFKGCSGLTQINIPENVTAIGDSAFYGCSGLTQINIPESVTDIGDYAFCDCSGLTQITIPENVTAIGHSAFYGCSGLKQINIPHGTYDKFSNMLSDYKDKLIEQ